MLRNSSLFKSISQILWPEYNDVASAKSFLCDKRGLSADRADAELAALSDMQAGLLCRLYDQGLRGDDIRQLATNFSTFPELSSALMCLDGSAFDQPFMDALSALFVEHHIKPFDALSLMMTISDQHINELHADLAMLRTKCLDAVRLLVGQSDHDNMILNFLVREHHITPEEARQKMLSSDPDIMELRIIESPSQRPLRY